MAPRQADRGRARAARALAAAFTGVLALAGCQDAENPTRPPMVVVTPPPVRSVVARPAPIEGFASGSYASVELQLTQAGELDLVVDWTWPESWIYVYVGRQACSFQELAGGSCPFLVRSETQLPKPRLVQTGPVEPGTYYVVLHNVARDPQRGIGSDNLESVSLEAGLTVSSFGRNR